MTPDHRLNIDLHCHSLFSDGVLAPEVLALRAQANGVDMLALTDHDTVDGVARARVQAKTLGLRFLSGVEISITFCGQTVHIVGLNLDETDPTLQAGLLETRHGRENRAREMGERLAGLGMPGAYEGALQLAGNPELLSRTHFARFLVQEGYQPDVQSVFDHYLKDGGRAYVPMRWASLEDCVHWILGAGGRAVVAHPGRYKFTPLQFGALFDTFRDLGGEAIEVTTGSHTDEDSRVYADVARQYGFLASRGSDFHSPEESRCDLGQAPYLPADLKPVWHDWI